MASWITFGLNPRQDNKSSGLLLEKGKIKQQHESSIKVLGISQNKQHSYASALFCASALFLLLNTNDCVSSEYAE
jgi:hypothetical protein